MTALGRAFVAVVPPAEVLDALDEVVARARREDPRTGPPLRWMRREQWHLTIQFLGRVADADELLGALRLATAGLSPFATRLAGAGAFASPARATVVWIGVGDGAGDLGTLAGTVTGATAPLGHADEPRPYHPHVTVARLGRPRGVQELLGRLGAGSLGPAWTVGELVLFESETRPEGARHTERGRVALGRLVDPMSGDGARGAWANIPWLYRPRS